MKIKNRITRIIEEEKLLSGDDTFDDILRRLKSNPAYLPSLSTVVKSRKNTICRLILSSD